ncbi:hypothetical protein HMPREF0971_03104 [Segatella oris F0302]|uniref:Uncharacterized protein n=1 Tax=Segatella oris F0302 TaxID=649760 RepID=D1QVR4_9BACT|nr:hypothetical protein HMPREF0971_03104 [Segatella oris F0302]
MWFPLFCYALQNGLQYASNQRVICVKLYAEVTQNAPQYALRLKGEMIRMTGQKHSFGKMICS